MHSAEPKTAPSHKLQAFLRLSLRAKVLAALSVPVAALFVALYSLYWLEGVWRRSDLEITRAYETREELLHLQERLLDASTVVGRHGATGEASRLKRFEASRNSVGQALERLAALTSGDSESKAALLDVKRASEDELDILGQAAGSAVSTLDRTQAVMDESTARRNAMSKVQNARIARARYSRDAARQTLFRVLIACGVLGSLAALFIHLLAVSRMVRRLQAVQENARNLAHELPLTPFPAGSDEIASLAREIETAAYLMQERERHLRQSESRYRDLFDRAPIPYLETDTEGVVRRFNQEVCTLLKCTPDRVLGRRAWDFISPEQQEEFRDALLKRIATGTEAEPVECDFMLEDGSRIWVEIRESLIRDERGVVTGVCRSLLDVTERNLAAVAARKVAQYASELRHKNEQLARALDAAHSATQAKSRFLASVSHELRTPLNGIIGFSELMQDGKIGPISDDQREILGDVLSSARHLMGLIGDILDISKVEAGKMEFRPEPAELSRLVHEVRDLIRTMADRKRIEVVAEVPDNFSAVLDPARFKQVLLNYLSNAVKFTPVGGRVTVRVELKDGSTVRVEVEDTGIGIAPEDMPWLFTEFRQLPNNRKADQGTGLGLALTRHIVEAQGGTVAVRSVLGSGSTFSAELPVDAQTVRLKV